jgi:hypothetical protein
MSNDNSSVVGGPPIPTDPTTPGYWYSRLSSGVPLSMTELDQFYLVVRDTLGVSPVLYTGSPPPSTANNSLVVAVGVMFVCLIVIFIDVPLCLTRAIRPGTFLFLIVFTLLIGVTIISVWPVIANVIASSITTVDQQTSINRAVSRLPLLVQFVLSGAPGTAPTSSLVSNSDYTLAYTLRSAML